MRPPIINPHLNFFRRSDFTCSNKHNYVQKKKSIKEFLRIVKGWNYFLLLLFTLHFYQSTYTCIAIKQMVSHYLRRQVSFNFNCTNSIISKVRLWDNIESYPPGLRCNYWYIKHISTQLKPSWRLSFWRYMSLVVYNSRQPIENKSF